jgi:ubiquinone/menaquinone biosynthesis C-methylase UbiE
MDVEHASGGAAAAARTWDEHATRYAGQERLEARAIEAALRLADPRPQDRVVDLATGTGVVLRALAARDPRPAQVTGVDRSAGMLAQVGQLPGDWRVIHGDARCVPVPDGAAEVVTCCYLLHLLGMEDRGRVLREARRLLRSAPGSRLVIVTVWANPDTVGGWMLSGLLSRLAAASPSRWGGLMPLDPTAELGPAGLVATHRVVLPRGGYPSLVVCARVA